MVNKGTKQKEIVKTQVTAVDFTPVVNAVKRFLRTFGAGIIAVGLTILAGLGVTPLTILLTAILVAVDKYLRDVGFYETVYYTSIGRLFK
jgi:hypothetical protein